MSGRGAQNGNHGGTPSHDAPMADCVLSSRVRLARNLVGFNFVNRSTQQQLSDIVLRVHDLDGVPADVRVSSTFRMQDALLTDLLERGVQPLPSQADGFEAPLKAWGIETVKVRMRAQ